MSGYASEEPERKHIKSGDLQFGQKDGKRAAELRQRTVSGNEELKRVNRLARLRVEAGSIEAAANLCLYAGLDLNDRLLREGIVNGRKLAPIAVAELSMDLLDEARARRDSGDYAGYTAIAGVLGYHPPETSDAIITTLNPNYDTENPFVETRTAEEIRLTERTGNGG